MDYSCNFDLYLRITVIERRHYYVVFVFRCKQVVFRAKNVISSRRLAYE